MVAVEPLALAGVIALLFLVVVRRMLGGSGFDTKEAEPSWERHQQAQQRAPPVNVGDEATAGVVDFSDHHSGAVHAVCKVEGFVVFVEDVPEYVDRTDVITFKITSFNEGGTSATATFLERG